MKKLLTVLLLCACILGCKDNKNPETICRRYAVIPIIEYVDKDTIVVNYIYSKNGVRMAESFGNSRITSIQHSYDTIWIGEKPKGEITSSQFYK